MPPAPCEEADRRKFLLHAVPGNGQSPLTARERLQNLIHGGNGHALDNVFKRAQGRMSSNPMAGDTTSRLLKSLVTLSPASRRVETKLGRNTNPDPKPHVFVTLLLVAKFATLAKLVTPAQSRVKQVMPVPFVATFITLLALLTLHKLVTPFTTRGINPKSALTTLATLVELVTFVTPLTLVTRVKFVTDCVRHLDPFCDIHA